MTNSSEPGPSPCPSAQPTCEPDSPMVGQFTRSASNWWRDVEERFDVPERPMPTIKLPLSKQVSVKRGVVKVVED